jgi:hypothetical protein
VRKTRSRCKRALPDGGRVYAPHRVERLKAERAAADRALAELEGSRNGATSIDVDDACPVLDRLPDLAAAPARAEPELRRRVFDAFRLSVAIDKNAAQIHVKALVSSAFTKPATFRASSLMSP